MATLGLFIIVNSPATQAQDPQSPNAPAASSPASDSKPESLGAPAIKSSATPPSDDSGDGKQTKRILGMVPNFQAVSANTVLPRLTAKQKFWLATEGTFDYSSFISAGLQAGVEQATNTYPEFREGAVGYGRYYWHTFADAGVENYFTGAIFPTILREDPRYYTLYRGGFWRRTGYATSRLLITKTDSGKKSLNFSEILGSGIGTEISSRYYPRQERRDAAEIIERWGSQLLNDGLGNVFQEFWPDINHRFFHRH